MTPEMLGGSCCLQRLPTAPQIRRGASGFLDVTQEWCQVAEGDKGHQCGWGSSWGLPGC